MAGDPVARSEIEREREARKLCQEGNSRDHRELFSRVGLLEVAMAKSNVKLALLVGGASAIFNAIVIAVLSWARGA